MKNLNHIIALLLLAGALAAQAADPRSRVGFYLEHFGGRVDPAEIADTYAVFDRVRAVADKNAKRWPELVVVRDLPAGRILALPDGHILLPAKALALLYQGVSLEQGDARLAFVLGHELAHMAEDDFWEADMARALAGSANLKATLGLQDRRHGLVAKETKADDNGFLYAALAGYPVRPLLDSASGGDFLSDWVKRTGVGGDSDHAPTEARSRLLRLRLEERLEQLEFFNMAVRLAHFGRCADALQFLSAFQTYFPSRELFNNIGYCRLQQALDAMTPERAGLYWLPGVLDGESLLSAVPVQVADNSTLRGGSGNPLADDYLRRAARAFETAVDKDPFYAPGLVNLATTRFLQGDVYKARAAVEQARKLRPKDTRVLTLRALILYEEGLEMDMGPNVLDMLGKLLDESGGEPIVRFNLARLLEQRGRGGKAARHWDELAGQISELPERIATQVCRKRPPSCAGEVGQDGGPWRPTVAVGTDLLDDTAAASKVENWRRIPFDWAGEPPMSGNLYVDTDQSLLELDGIVEMAAFQPPGDRSSSQLRQRFGQPHGKRRLSSGEVWSYGGWAARLDDDRVREIWISESD